MASSAATPKHSFFRQLWNAGGTGGLYWHAHALRHQSSWQRTSEQIAAFLLRQHLPQSRHLLLIGPSAGWMLPTSWLRSFQRIDVYDIDPLVPLLFGWRHARHLVKAGAQVHYHRLDAMHALDDILQTHPQACIWFDNVLGQHRYRVRDVDTTQRDLNALKSRLAGRTWGSVHDWLSGPVRQVTPMAAIDEIAARSQDPVWTQQRLAQIQAMGTWSDHLTSCVFDEALACQYLAWPYSAEYSHWLQIGWVSA